MPLKIQVQSHSTVRQDPMGSNEVQGADEEAKITWKGEIQNLVEQGLPWWSQATVPRENNWRQCRDIFADSLTSHLSSSSACLEWRRQWQRTPVLLPESPWTGSLVGCSPGLKSQIRLKDRTGLHFTSLHFCSEMVTLSTTFL